MKSKRVLMKTDQYHANRASPLGTIFPIYDDLQRSTAVGILWTGKPMMPSACAERSRDQRGQLKGNITRCVAQREQLLSNRRMGHTYYMKFDGADERKLRTWVVHDASNEGVSSSEAGT
jgi:hypothetical protein